MSDRYPDEDEALAEALDDNEKLRGLLREARKAIESMDIALENEFGCREYDILVKQIDAALGAAIQPITEEERTAGRHAYTEHTERASQPPAGRMLDLTPVGPGHTVDDATADNPSQQPVGRDECEHGHYPVYCPVCGFNAPADNSSKPDAEYAVVDRNGEPCYPATDNSSQPPAVPKVTAGKSFDQFHDECTAYARATDNSSVPSYVQCTCGPEVPQAEGHRKPCPLAATS
jgi:hypothetical protein